MPKQNQRVEVNAFSKGLITEASELNIKPDACVDVLNFEFNRDGTINRRLGMDVEPLFPLTSSGISKANYNYNKINSFRWDSVGGDPSKNYLVVQVNNVLYFFTIEESDDVRFSFVKRISLDSWPSSVKYSFDACNGNLVLVDGTGNVKIVTNEIGVGGFYELNVSSARILTRDVWGVEVKNSSFETDPLYRGPSDSENYHYYNLRNQSWGVPRKNTNGVLVDPIDYFKSENSNNLPSNSEQVWAGLQFQAVAANQQPFERMYNNLYTEVLGSSIRAPKGYFIIDALSRGASRRKEYYKNTDKFPELLININFFPYDETIGGPTCISEYAGRIFYAGFSGNVPYGDARSPDFSNHVFFSQLVKNKADLVKCYQEGDPTSRDNADVVDTDGGFVRISGANKIIALNTIGDSLVVFASNGVWAIDGGGNSGFTATNYRVTKLGSTGIVGKFSVIEAESSLFFWAYDGIYQITRNQFGELVVQSLTFGTIDGYYQKIDNTAKINCTGEYDFVNKKIRWLYKVGTGFSVNSLTYELVFDVVLKIFYPNLITDSVSGKAEIIDVFKSGKYFLQQEPQCLKYVALIDDGSGVLKLTNSFFYKTDFKDWASVNVVGVDSKAYALTGVMTANDSASEKFVPYLVWNMRKTEVGVDTLSAPKFQSSCKLQIRWGFSTSVSANKWSQLSEVYRYIKTLIPQNNADSYDNGFGVVSTKNKIRGSGKGFQIYFETSPNKDCKVLGWSITFNVNQYT